MFSDPKNLNNVNVKLSCNYRFSSMNPIQITDELISKYQTAKGGFTKDVLAAFGVSWPPVKGWKAQAIGKMMDADKLPPLPSDNATGQQDLF
jgi:hypothetical protein